MSHDRTGSLATLNGHLQATAELAVASPADRYLGEAQAVAADVADGDADEVVIANRVEQVGELLDRIDQTDNSEADAHVEAAREAVDAALAAYRR